MKSKKQLLQEIHAMSYSMFRLTVLNCETVSEAKASIENELHLYYSFLTQRMQGNDELWHLGKRHYHSSNFIIDYIEALQEAANYLNYKIVCLNNDIYKLVSR